MSQDKPSNTDQSASKDKNQDWGLADQDSGGSPVKVALLLVVTLIAGLGFIVYRKYTAQQNLQAARSEDFRDAEGDGDGEKSQSTPDANAIHADSDGHGTEFIAEHETAHSNDSFEFVQTSGDAPDQQGEPLVTDWSEPDVQADPPEQATFAFEEPPDAAVAEDSVQGDEPWNPFGSDDLESVESADVETAEVAEAEPFFVVEESEPADAEAFVPEFNREPATAAVESEGATWDLSDGETLEERQPPLLVSDDPVETQDSEAAMDLFGRDEAPIQAEPAGETLPPAGSPFSVAESSEPADRPPELPDVNNEPLLIDAPAADVIRVASEDAASDDSSLETWESVPVRQESGLADASEENSFFFEEPIDDAPAESIDQEPDFVAFPGEVPEPPAATEAPVDDFLPDVSSSTGSDPFSPATATWNGAPGGDQVTLHVVKRGENFWTISQRYYAAGRYFSALAAYNSQRIPDPQRMQPGMKVLVPSREVLQQRFPNLTGTPYGPSSADEQRPGFFVDRTGQPMYRVGKNDTLSRIAQKHLGRSFRWKQLYGMNQDVLTNSDSLKIGMVLRLPADAAHVSVAPAGQLYR